MVLNITENLSYTMFIRIKRSLHGAIEKHHGNLVTCFSLGRAEEHNLRRINNKRVSSSSMRYSKDDLLVRSLPLRRVPPHANTLVPNHEGDDRRCRPFQSEHKDCYKRGISSTGWPE